MSDIKKALRVALAMRGMKRKELAATMGVSQAAVHHWISTDRSMTIETINRIAKGIGIKTSELIALGE